MTENREVKSDVFAMLMMEKKYALQVYNAVNNTSYENPEDIQIFRLWYFTMVLKTGHR